MSRSFLALRIIALLAIVSGVPVHADDPPPLAVAPFAAEQARAFQQQWARRIGQEVVLTNSIGMKLVLLPPGEFTMGRTEEQFDQLLKVVKNDPELRKNYGGMVTWSMLMMPAHRVRITRPFYMGQTEVTVGQFRQFVEATGYKTEAEQGLVHGKPYKGGRPLSTWRKPMAWRKPPFKQKDDEPVMHLCWNDCVAFCDWLSKKEGVPYALPTEAEWEYACRAGTTTPWSFGDFADFERQGNKYAIWSDGGQKFDVPQPVAQRKPNPFGLYDMHGNMWEYVADWWHRLSYKEAPLNDPTGPAVQSEKNDQRRIIRGSSFDWGRWGGDSAYRMRITQRSNQHPHMSFRVVRRIKGVEGVPPAVDPEAARRKETRDPGADSAQVLAALKAASPKEKLPRELTLDLGGGIHMPFVLIPAGSFLMGSARGLKDESPVHRVVISKPFYMAKYEVTQGQWQAVMGKDKRLAELTRGDNEMSGPMKAMNGMSWNNCQQFVSKLQQKVPGRHFALPTEAQWEYACRAGSNTAFHFGDDASKLGDYAWYQGNMNWPGQPGFRGKGFYHDVGQKKPNQWGLHDMHGGVWEWCADRYDADYYLTSPLVDPPGPKTGRFRVLRGGSWFRYAKYARSAYRRFFHPDSDSDGVTAWILDFGCRVVINLPVEPKPRGKVGRTPLDQARQLVRSPHNPILDVGKPGDWDEGRCGCFTVCQVGKQFYLYYMGSGSKNPWRIGVAVSSDGIHWQRCPSNPVLPQGQPGTWDDKQVSMPYVLKDGKTFYLWYTGSGSKGGGFGLATSTDGATWKRHGTGPVMQGIGGSMDPCVRKFAGKFIMWYCGRVNGKFRLFRATSPDGIRWVKESDPVLPLGQPGDFDSHSHAGPCVVKVGDLYYLFHLGSNGKKWTMGLATSPDGKDWKKVGARILDVGGKTDWDGGSILGFDVLWLDGRFHVWYAAHPLTDADKPESEQAIRIGYAVSEVVKKTTGGTKPIATPTQKTVTANKTYLLTCPKPNGNIELKVVDRDQVDKARYVDIAGLRIYADTIDSRRNAYGRLLGKIANHFYAQHFLTDTLSKLRSETGVEPDTVPVMGEKGKQLGTAAMVLIKGGEFIRPGKYLRSNYVTEPVEVKGEKYRVRISSFYMDKYKVTNQHYCDFLNDGNAAYWTPWNPRIVKNRQGLFVPADPLLANIHVVSVHWFQAQGYAKWAGKRLPTEAEWEFAAGGPEGRKYPWGNEPPDKTRANFNSKLHTPGDAFPAGATPDGVFDLVGNSAEWIADFYDEDYYRKAPAGGVLVDPKGPAQGSRYHKYRRMFKGICKGFESPNMLCVFKRHSRPPLLPASAGIGFRCVKDAEDRAGAGVTRQEPPAARAKIDAIVNDFRLRDLMQDKPSFVTLSQFRGKQVVVLVSIQSRCPITWRYIARIGKMYQDYKKKGVAFLMIRSSATDSEDRIRRYAEDKNLDMPLLFDEANKVADYFGTQGTPYFYVIDKQGVLRYEGIFDNNQVPKRVDLKPETATEHYVRNALDAVLLGKPVKQKSVPIGST